MPLAQRPAISSATSPAVSTPTAVCTGPRADARGRGHATLQRRRGRHRRRRASAGTSAFTIALPDWDPARGAGRGASGAEPPAPSAASTSTPATPRSPMPTSARRFDVRRIERRSARPRRWRRRPLPPGPPAHHARRMLASRLARQTWVLDAARHPVIDLRHRRRPARRHPFRRRHRPDRRCVGDAGAARAGGLEPERLGPRPRPAADRRAGRRRTDPEFAGLLNGVARITGPAATPEVLGSFAIERGRFRELQFERVAGAVHYAAGRVGVDVVVEQAPGVTLAVNGSVPLALFTTQRHDGRRACRRRRRRPRRSISTSRARRLAWRS